ncbi:MAG TPA: dCTP deaminase [Solirubrobacterales bacterium]|nr:dCTP deaminase [Solirubrobacterales bacterium]
MALLTDSEIRQAVEEGEIEIEPLGPESVQPASYDLRLGEKAIVTRTLEIDKVRERVEQDEAQETDVAEAGSISIPAGAFALIVTRERVRFGAQYAGHLGLRSYFARKGVLLLSGLQVDPGFEGYLVLGFANVSPRSVHISYEEAVATLEIQRLNRPAAEPYSGVYAGQQTSPEIPRADADYLRTIETLSVSDLTRALLRLSDNVSELSNDVGQLARYVKVVWIPVAIAVLVALVTVFFN